jgi:hypothetical protein
MAPVKAYVLFLSLSRHPIAPHCSEMLTSPFPHCAFLVVNSERAAYYAPDFLMKFRNTRKAQLQAIIEESLLAAPKKSLSLGRKTGSNILKGNYCGAAPTFSM